VPFFQLKRSKIKKMAAQTDTIFQSYRDDGHSLGWYGFSSVPAVGRSDAEDKKSHDLRLI